MHEILAQHRQESYLFPDATFWDNLFKENSAQVMVHNPYLLTEVTSLSPGTVLDLGCGTGENLHTLTVRGWRCVGVDWSPSAIAYANKFYKSSQCTFYCGDTRIWQPPQSQQFDLVISTFAIPEGKENARKMLTNGINLLKPGGYMVIFEWDQSMEELWNRAVPASHQVHNLLLSLQDIRTLMSDITITKEQIYHCASDILFPQPEDRRRNYQDYMRIACVYGYKSSVPLFPISP